MLIELTMKDISLIVLQLKNKQAQIDRKIDHILNQNLDPFPFARLDKGKKLIDLIKKTLQSIEEDNLIGWHAYQRIGNGGVETGSLILNLPSFSSNTNPT